MNDNADIKKLWTCPKCGRQFERRGQSHSCRSYPLEKHFERKTKGRLLFNKLKKELRGQLGPFKIESLECCIHFVGTCTFAAVKIFRDRIRVDFSLSRKIENKRIGRFVQLSAHRYLFDVDIGCEEEIDEELMNWIREAYGKKSAAAGKG